MKISLSASFLLRAPEKRGPNAPAFRLGNALETVVLAAGTLGSTEILLLPESTSLTYEWLRQANGPAGYSRRLLAGYGHADCWLGKNAAADVFPHALQHLEATAS